MSFGEGECVWRVCELILCLNVELLIQAFALLQQVLFWWDDPDVTGLEEEIVSPYKDCTTLIF